MLALSAAGDDEQALEEIRRALAIIEPRGDIQEVEIASAVQQLGELALEEGDRALARRLFERALAMRREMLPEGHEDIAESAAALDRL